MNTATEKTKQLQWLDLDDQDSIVTIWLNRPDKLNGVNIGMMQELLHVGKQLKRRKNLRAVIISGRGDAFCAGLDIADTMKQPVKILWNFLPWRSGPSNLFQRVHTIWRDLPLPVICVIHGHCYGAGMQLALSADFRIAHDASKLSILEAKWGLIPDMSASLSLPELLPIDIAKRLTMTGEIITAQQALSYGLISEINNEPIRAAQALITQIVTRSPDSVALAKRLFHKTWRSPAWLALHFERYFQRKLLLSKNTHKIMAGAQKGEVAKFDRRRV